MALSDSPLPQNLPLPVGATHHHQKNHPLDGPPDPDHHPKRHNWRTYTELNLLLLLLLLLPPELTVSQCVQ